MLHMDAGPYEAALTTCTSKPAVHDASQEPMHAAQPRPSAPTIFSANGWIPLAILVAGIAFAFFAIDLVSGDRWVLALAFLVFWSGIFLLVRARWRQQQQRRLLWMFALVMGMLYV